MCRTRLSALALAVFFVLGGLPPALAGTPPPSGTITCAVSGRYHFFSPYLFGAGDGFSVENPSSVTVP
jgi:hypothetical protein